MINPRSNNSLWIRFLAILLGTALLFWLPFEDTNETMAILFAYIISVWLIAALLLRNKHRSPFPIFYFIFAGILAGAIVTPLILSLMVFKTGLHAHPVPDYSYEQIISIIRRTPIWLTSGFFIGTGLGIIINSQQIRQETYRALER